MADYFLRMEPTADAAPLSVDQIVGALRACGLAPRRATRVDGGWYVQVRASAAPREIALPDGWRVAESARVLDARSWVEGLDLRPVGDVFTFILLTWPAVVGMFFLSSDGWDLAARIALAVWLVLMHGVAYGRSTFFGNSLLLLTGCVAAFWWTHPGPWMYLWLAIILIGVYASVRGVLKIKSAPSSSAAGTEPSGGNG